MSVLFTRRGAPPTAGKLLSDYSEGDIVYLNEAGSPVAFYVAKHDYERDLNGVGRTLLARKDCCNDSYWDDTSQNNYALSDLDTWLNGTYKNSLDSDVQAAISTTSFYYTTGYNIMSVQTMIRSIFLPSLTELGLSFTTSVKLGTKLPISAELLIGKFNGSTVAQWTRSTQRTSKSGVYKVNADGTGTSTSPNSTYCYSRPLFTLPADAKFDGDTNEFKGVM